MSDQGTPTTHPQQHNHSCPDPSANIDGIPLGESAPSSNDDDINVPTAPSSAAAIQPPARSYSHRPHHRARGHGAEADDDDDDAASMAAQPPSAAAGDHDDDDHSGRGTNAVYRFLAATGISLEHGTVTKDQLLSLLNHYIATGAVPPLEQPWDRAKSFGWNTAVMGMVESGAFVHSHDANALCAALVLYVTTSSTGSPIMPVSVSCLAPDRSDATKFSIYIRFRSQDDKRQAQASFLANRVHVARMPAPNSRGPIRLLLLPPNFSLSSILTTDEMSAQNIPHAAVSLENKEAKKRDGGGRGRASSFSHSNTTVTNRQTPHHPQHFFQPAGVTTHHYQQRSTASAQATSSGDVSSGTWAMPSQPPSPSNAEYRNYQQHQYHPHHQQHQQHQPYQNALPSFSSTMTNSGAGHSGPGGHPAMATSVPSTNSQSNLVRLFSGISSSGEAKARSGGSQTSSLGGSSVLSSCALPSGQTHNNTPLSSPNPQCASAVDAAASHPPPRCFSSEGEEAEEPFSPPLASVQAVASYQHSPYSTHNQPKEKEVNEA